MTGSFFIAYVDLSLIMGQFTQHQLRKGSSKDCTTTIEDSLYRWTKNLPDQLLLSSKSNPQMLSSQSPRPYNLECRQLNVLYLTTIILLYRSKTLGCPLPTAAVMAASTIAGIFEDFLARDEVRFLGPAFSFHLLAASIALLSCYRYPDLWALAHEDLEILTQAQEEMKKRWPSALGSIGSFDRMFKLTVATLKKVAGVPKSSLTPYQAVLLEVCDMNLCRMYSVLTQKDQFYDGRDQGDMLLTNSDRTSSGNVHVPGSDNQLKPVAAPFCSQANQVAAPPLLEQTDPAEDLAFDQMFQGEAGSSNGAIGDWLFWDQLALDGI